MTGEKALLAGLDARTDPSAIRMKRYLDMPDLSRTPGSPLCEIIERVKSLPSFKNFDHIQIPEIVPAEISFDLFAFAPDHPARSTSDTYYVDEKNILRTHDTIMWYYYLNTPEVTEKINLGETLGVMCYGKVYRKDEIDRRHMNTFHQMDALYLVPNSLKTLTIENLREVLREIVISLFGLEVKYRFLDDTFPYTDPSLQIEVEIDGQWMEVMGGGMPKKNVLKKMGLEGYNGWAFGFGLERLAMISTDLPDIRLLWSEDERVKKQLKFGRSFTEVSKYPSVVRDISFIVNEESFNINQYSELILDTVGPDMVEESALLDEYRDEKKFGLGHKSYAYRITYRRLDRTLTSIEVDALHKKLEEETKKIFGAIIR